MGGPGGKFLPLAPMRKIRRKATTSKPTKPITTTGLDMLNAELEAFGTPAEEDSNFDMAS